MRFENINGKMYLVLANLDSIYLTTEEYINSKAIKVECDQNQLKLSGNGNIISEITGDNMLEKVSFPKLLSKEDILEKCDVWLQMFREIHDKFSELVLTEKCKKEHIGMKVIISSNPDEFDQTKEKRSISISLMKHQNIIQDGVSISTTGEENKGIFQYLALNVMKHYFLKNYNKFIQYSDDALSYLLTSEYSFNESEMQPMILFIGGSTYSNAYLDFFRSVFSCHNLGITTKSMEANITNNISSQYLSSSFLDSYQESIKQYEYITEYDNEEERHVYEKVPQKMV